MIHERSMQCARLMLISIRMELFLEKSTENHISYILMQSLIYYSVGIMSIMEAFICRLACTDVMGAWLILRHLT